LDILSYELIYSINWRDVYYLYQEKCEPRMGMVCSNSLTGEEMELEGILCAESQSFRCALINFGVLLQDRLDALKWMGRDLLGQLSVKNVYMALEKKKWIHNIRGWWKALWLWEFPLKIELFI
jgi:hypothetical protein